MKAKIFTIAVLFSLSAYAYCQEEQWEPQFKLTGYVATEYEYFKNIKYFSKDYAFSLSEGGLLANYQPVKNLTIKTVFVYRPGFDFDNMLNEANIEYKLHDFINVKVGRFLTPLSPMNTYYYAPVNNSATLPMIISHYEIFPLNMDAVSFNGKIGDKFKFKYDVFAGGFRNSLLMRTGSLGLFGYEDQYLTRTDSTEDISTTDVNDQLNIGGGAHIGISYQDNLDLGFGIFKTEEPVTMVDFLTGSPQTIYADKFSYGVNLKAKVATLQLLAEAWRTNVKINGMEMKIDGGFAELSNTFNKITPYARFEYHDAGGTKFNRYTAGVCYKPIFETTLKLEYIRYDHDVTDLNGIVASLIFSF